MPTKDSDIVIQHLGQLFRVWVVTADAAQEPDRSVSPTDWWSQSEAESDARRWAAETGGQIFQLQKDGRWSILK